MSLRIGNNAKQTINMKKIKAIQELYPDVKVDSSRENSIASVYYVQSVLA